MKILKRYTKKRTIRQRDVRVTICTLDWKQTKVKTELYGLARQRDRAGKDVEHVRVMKDEYGNVMLNSEAVLRRWNEYNENNVPPAQLQKTPLNRKGILAAVPIC